MTTSPTPQPHAHPGCVLRTWALALFALVLGVASMFQPAHATEPHARAAVIPVSLSESSGGVRNDRSGGGECAAETVSTITDELLDWAESILSEARQAIGSPTADAQRVVAESIGVRLLMPRATHTQGDNPDDAATQARVLDWQRPAQDAHTPERLVLLVHGLDEPGDIWDELAPAIREHGLRVARFDYPNDQAIADSTDLLAEALAILRADGTQRIDLVCHSMGGLIARDLLTRDAYYAGNAKGGKRIPRVERVITVGTPNYGAPLAPLRGLAEVRDQLVRLVNADTITLGDLLRFSSDGNGQAGIDLVPGSDFLTALNDRPFPTGARWTVIVGRVASSEDVNALADHKLIRAMGIPKDDLNDLIKLLGQLSDDLGDGAVPVSSAPLPDVRDIVEIQGNHRSMLRTIHLEQSLRKALGAAPVETPPAIEVILDRLLKPIEPPSVGAAED